MPEAKGWPGYTGNETLTLTCDSLPIILAPCQQRLPEEQNEELKVRNRHVDFLIRDEAINPLIVRAFVVRKMREFFDSRGFLEVFTPILAKTAGGAIARSFKTTATEFENRELSLRISPELWLKRLAVGGMGKIYEIGPSFRNEGRLNPPAPIKARPLTFTGIDSTHNPEFWTCEFYAAYKSLPELMIITQLLFQETYKSVRDCGYVAKEVVLDFEEQRIIDFIPAIEALADFTFPNLKAPDAAEKIRSEMERRQIPLPSEPNLPRMLDKLCSHFLEPLCDSPTWIVYQPECLSPLAKSFSHGSNNQIVAARAELFIQGKEFVNTYEEENNPTEQRRKFEQQLQFNAEERIDDRLDEQYLEVMTWGMPPTGGWGCGIDRLVMFLGGHHRIADVLAFGTLRNVVGLGNNQDSPVTNGSG